MMYCMLPVHTHALPLLRRETSPPHYPSTSITSQPLASRRLCAVIASPCLPRRGGGGGTPRRARPLSSMPHARASADQSLSLARAPLPAFPGEPRSQTTPSGGQPSPLPAHRACGEGLRVYYCQDVSRLARLGQLAGWAVWMEEEGGRVEGGGMRKERVGRGGREGGRRARESLSSPPHCPHRLAASATLSMITASVPVTAHMSPFVALSSWDKEITPHHKISAT